MPFTQVDDNTVMDGEGNQYFMPFPSSPSGLGLPSGSTRDPGPSQSEDGTPIPPPPAQYVPPQLQSLVPPQDPATIANKDFAVPLQAQPRPRSKPSPVDVKSAQNSLMTNDVTAFSQGGGVAGSDEDFARMVGGHAGHEAETAKAQAVARNITAQGQIEKMKTQAAMVLQTADDYDKKASQIMSDAKGRWEDWKKRNDAAAAQLVDPQHAFTNGSRLSKINWSLYFLGAGFQGGEAVNQAMNMVNKMVEDDVAVQKYNIDNKHKGLDQERLAIQEQDKLGKDSLAEWYFAKNLRLQAVGQSMDAKIAEIGQPAAAAAGLLAARDAIEKEVLKGQEHVGDHFFDKAKEQTKFTHDIYLERLKAQLKLSEEAFKHKLSQDKNDTLPTNTQLGLQMVDKNTGQVLPGGKIPLKVKGEKAVEAGQITSQANEEASQLRDVQNELKGMSTPDLIRGGSAKFKAMVKDLIQTRAVRDNGHRLSDADVDRAAQEEFGVVMKDSIARNTVDAARLVGPYKDGLEKTIDMQLRNLASKTMNRLAPYIDSDTAQAYDIQYNVQGTHVPEQNPEADDLNTAITKAAGGGNASDLLVPGPRPEIKEDTLPKPGDLDAYHQEKEKGRGLEGGLPRIPQPQEDKVNRASATFSHATVDDILRLSGAYLRDPKLSAEAKHEIRMESLDALSKAQDRESAVLEEAIKEYGESHHSVESVDNNGVGTGYEPESPYKKNSNEFTPEFDKFFNSGLVDEMRKRAGLEPRKK